MTTRHSSRDRTPSRRAVPVLLALGLLLLIGWLLVAIDRQGQPQPGAAAPPGPSTLSIPRIGVRAPIVGVGRQADGAMQVPDPGQVGWYRLGPRPGNPGPAVLIGHVDTRTGPDVFYRLDQLRPGDEILVGQPDGTTTRIWTRTARPLLRLITCAGSFDRTTGHYRDNLILYASPTGA